jgi:hypothetical protein
LQEGNSIDIKRAFGYKNPIINIGTFFQEKLEVQVIRSILVESGAKKILIVGVGFCVGVAILIALLEKLALILAYYFA